jgi:phosphohistidine phosphatase
MDLILWRHAEAVEAADGKSDFDRELTGKGERHAARMADWLNRRLPASTRVLVSPAKRAQQTARALDRKLRTVDSIGPDVDADAVLAAARWPTANEPVLVVGHQPTLGFVLSKLLADGSTSWSIRKGAV